MQGIKRYYNFRDYKWESGNGIDLPKIRCLSFGHLQEKLVIHAPLESLLEIGTF